MVADCEGCLCDFFEENKDFVTKQLKNVMYEADVPTNCDYKKIAFILTLAGFEKVIDGFVSFWKKRDLEENVLKLLEVQKKAHLRDGPLSIEQRKEWIDRLINSIIEYQDKIPVAISKDFSHRSETSSLLTDVASSITSLKIAKNNIKPIDCLNKKLDPNLHQAMMEIEDDQKEPGTIVQEVQKGFMIKERLLRPSLVGVSKKTVNKDDKTEENKENLDK